MVGRKDSDHQFENLPTILSVKKVCNVENKKIARINIKLIEISWFVKKFLNFNIHVYMDLVSNEREVARL